MSGVILSGVNVQKLQRSVHIIWIQTIFPMLHIVLNAPTPLARLFNFKMDNTSYFALNRFFMFRDEADAHLKSVYHRVLVLVNCKMPCYFLPCWVISWPDKVHYLFLSYKTSKDDHALNKSGGSKVSLWTWSERPRRTFCHDGTCFRFSLNWVLKRLSVDSL